MLKNNVNGLTYFSELCSPELYSAPLSQMLKKWRSTKFHFELDLGKRGRRPAMWLSSLFHLSGLLTTVLLLHKGHNRKCLFNFMLQRQLSCNTVFVCLAFKAEGTTKVPTSYTICNWIKTKKICLVKWWKHQTENLKVTWNWPV